MKTYQIIFRGGRVQNLLADRYSRKNGTVQFRTGQTTIEFPAGDLIMIDELADEGMNQSPGKESPFKLMAALG